MSAIKAVIFDWGTVLIENPAPKLVAYCANALGVSEADFVRAQNMHIIDFQKGILSEAQFWERMTKDLNVAPPTQESLWGDAFRAGYVERKEMFALIERLKQRGYIVGFLSNTEESPRKYFYELGYDKIFDEIIFSCDEGIVKPDPAIYHLILERLNMKPEETLFIDDKKENTDAAQELGMNVITYVTSEQAIQELGKFGI